MSHLLHKMAVAGEIDWLSFSFAEFICQQANQPNDSLLGQSAALISEANLAGDVCVDLAHHETGSPIPDLETMREIENPEQWIDRLLESNVVGTPGQERPLVIDENRLYLYRNWHYETRVANFLKARMKAESLSRQADLAPIINQIFADAQPQENEQKIAVEKAVRQGFSVISGGPGTGKTTTVVKILATILSLQPQTRIALAAPTGKAAARMSNSIKGRIDNIEINDDLRRRVPLESATLHRLLGFSQNRFRFHQDHRLPYDCVIVDEASMIDLRLMFQLLQALPDHARLILLGDRDQLASVAAGNVLGDITGHGRSLQQATEPLQDSISLLTHSYRFDSTGGIAALAQKVNSGNVGEAIAQLEAGAESTVWIRPDKPGLSEPCQRIILDTYRHLLTASNPEAALAWFDKFRVLATLNNGPQGVIELNRLISQKLLQEKQVNTEWFQGLPIMINRNHHDLNLFNGDTGVIWLKNNQTYACFNDQEHNTRWIRLNRLRDFSPAWVTTVHKSQGSEFDHVLLILPEDSESDSLSRELLYTALTRARSRFILQGTQNVLQAMIKTLTRRHSGLAQRLGW